MKIYSKYPEFRFIALAGKVPREKGPWRLFPYAEAKRRIVQGGNVGFVIPSNMLVIDVDPRNGGLESYEKLLTAIGAPDLSTCYPTAITGGGGLHIYAAHTIGPEKIATFNPQFPGIDIKRRGGYVVAAGSIHPETKKPYEVYNDQTRIPPILPALLSLYKRSIRPVAPTESEALTVGEIITPAELAELLARLDVSLYNTNETWFPIMCAARNATRGAGVEEFLSWSLSDPKFAGDEQTIRARWDSVRHDTPNPITLGTLRAEVSRAQLSGIASALDPVTEPPAEIAEPTADDDQRSYGYKNDGDLPHLIALRVLERHILISASDGRFWEYNGKYWKPIGRNVISNYAVRAYARMGQTKSLSSVLSATLGVIEALTAKTSTPGAEPPAGHSIVNVNNGELWIDDHTGAAELFPHAPESNQVNCLPLDYDPKAKAPRFEQFLQEIFEPERPKDAAEIIRHLIEVMGYTIQARKNIATWVLFTGRGANGKTVLLSILSALLGEAALEKPIGSISIDRNNHAMADLPGKLAIIDDDVSYNTVLPDGELKRLSENKWLSANPKNATPYRFRSIAIPILSANSYPVARDLSEGLRRRAQVFRFKRTFSITDQDVNLTDYIVTNELSGVLNVFLEGLRRVRARGQFDPPAVCLEAREAWYSANNTIVDFVQTRLVRSVSRIYTKFKPVWTDYINYCVENGILRPMTRGQFRYALDAAGVPVETVRGAVVVKGWQLKKT